MIDERYDRQLRLAEIGPDGQSRIEAHGARVLAGPSAGVALAYLARAGVGSVSIERAGAEQPFAHAGSFHFSGPLAVAAGAHRALAELERALERAGAR